METESAGYSEVYFTDATVLDCSIVTKLRDRVS
jgi:hypothetical protein